MPRLKNKYPQPEAPAVQPLQLPLPYSFDLKGASQFTGFSVWALRQAIYDGRLQVVNPKPYIIRRRDLEKFVDGGLHVVVKKAAAA